MYIFLLSAIGSIVIARGFGILDVIWGNPHPLTILGAEMHHFYYGMIILFVCLPMYFIKPSDIAAGLTGFGLGLMLDEAFFIVWMIYVPYSGINPMYAATMPYTVVLFAVLSVVTLYIFYHRGKNP
jgi:hypothetical protein